MDKSVSEWARFKWPQVLDYIRLEGKLSYPAFRNWIRPLKITAVEEDCEGAIIYLTFEEEQYLHYIESHFGAIIEEAARTVLIGRVLPEQRRFLSCRVEFGCPQQPEPVEVEEKVLVEIHGGGNDWLDLEIRARDNDTTLVVSGRGILNDLFASVVKKEIDATKIRKIVFGETIDISQTGFCSYFPNVEEVKLPSETSRISVEAFKNCKQLKSLCIPPEVHSIDRAAFAGSGLQQLKLPEGIRWIYRQAFMDCSELTGDILIPESASKINDEVFAGLKNPIRLIFLSADTVIDSNMLGEENHDHITMVGYPGSTAEAFAHEQGVRFEILPEENV